MSRARFTDDAIEKFYFFLNIKNFISSISLSHILDYFLIILVLLLLFFRVCTSFISIRFFFTWSAHRKIKIHTEKINIFFWILNDFLKTAARFLLNVYRSNIRSRLSALSCGHSPLEKLSKKIFHSLFVSRKISMRDNHEHVLCYWKVFWILQTDESSYWSANLTLWK